MKKILLVIGIIIVALIIAIVLILGYFGFIPAISKLMGTDQPRDLGIEYSNEDLQSATKKSKVETKKMKNGKEPEQSVKYTGSQKADFSLSSEEFSALANSYAQSWEYFPGENIQIKINEDGTAESSGLVRVDKVIGYIKATGNNFSEEDIQKALDYLQLSRRDSIPYYFKMSGKIEDNKITDISADKLEIGRFPIPKSMVEGVIPQVKDFGNKQIEDFAGLKVEESYVEGGKIKFKGQVPDEIDVSS